MFETTIKPWEMGEATTGIPPLCVGDLMLVKLAFPREKTVRDGLVGTFMLTSYKDKNDKIIKTIEVKEGPGGYEVSFPLGKKNLIATKFRGPKSYYRFQNPNDGSYYVIPQEKFSVEYATQYCATKIKDWDTLNDIEQDEHIDKYLEDMFMFGLSQDLMLPIEGDSFTAPTVGMQCKLYRVYTPPLEGEKYGNTIITKWHKGEDPLTAEYEILPEILATTAYEEYYKRDVDTTFDPTTLEVDEDDTI